MYQLLRICLVLLGASAVAIALSIIILGAEVTASGAERVFDAALGRKGDLGEHWPATMDSELRFYAALWGAYGLVLLNTAWQLPQSLSRVPWLMAVFFTGGVGRALSRAMLGAPHAFFTMLMVIELCFPVLVVGLWLGARRHARAGQ